MVRAGLWPVSLARTFSAFCSFSPPSPTPMLTVTLAMRGTCIGLLASGALLCMAVLGNRLHLGLGQVGRLADGEGVRLDRRERLVAHREVDEVGLVAARGLDGLDGRDLAGVAAVGDEHRRARLEREVAQDLLRGQLQAQDVAGGVVVLL